MRRLAALLIVPLLVLTAGCGNDSDSASSSALPTVTGKFGEKPTVTLPKATPSKTLEAKTLIEGSGPEVKKGQLLVAHYLGETYRDGRVFDDSYSRKAPAGFPIGVGKVIPGWDEKLVGVKGGSRVLLTIPPDKGYGAQGQPNAGIKGDDTLVFVVDILGGYDPAAGAKGTPVPPDTSGTLPTVTGEPGKEPTVTVPAGKAPPKQLVKRTVSCPAGTRRSSAPRSAAASSRSSRRTRASARLASRTWASSPTRRSSSSSTFSARTDAGPDPRVLTSLTPRSLRSSA